MRYAWVFPELYKRAARPNFIMGPLFSLILEYLRRWDVASAARPNDYIANSHNVRRRIERYYGKGAVVIHPPVDSDFFVPDGGEADDYWLLLSAMVPYKDLDKAIEAFNESGRSLHVVGDGPERMRLEKMAKDNVLFFSWLEREDLRRKLQRSRGLVFPGEEDFGITPLEANACGRPVVALGKGGVLESQEEEKTALFYEDQSSEAINSAIERAESRRWDSAYIRERAVGFSRNSFKSAMEREIEEKLSAFRTWLSSKP